MSKVRIGMLAGLALLAALAVFLVQGLTQSPKAEAWDRWAAHDPESQLRVSHRAWQQFLARFVKASAKDANTVAYGAVQEADRVALDRYLAALAATPISRYSRDEQLSYWINLYNALTVDVVLDHYPVDSILQINPSANPLAKGPWDEPVITVEGQEISLNDIEHRILRPLWRDPRLHYALNCASIGCPDLIRSAYESYTAEYLMEKAAATYINDPRGVHLENGRLVLSSLYQWYGEDFGADQGALLEHLRRYADAPLAEQLAQVTKIDGYRYDWALNDGSAPTRSKGPRSGSFSR